MSEKSTLWPTPRQGKTTDETEASWQKRRDAGGVATPPLTLAVKMRRGSSPAVFPASHSVVPGSERASRMTVSFGLKCSALLRNSSPVGCLVRTLLESSTWRSTIVLLRWKPSATPHGRLLFRLAPSTPRTDATGCGLWRTPTAAETHNQDYSNQIYLQNQVKDGMWPTPTESEGKHGVGSNGRTASLNSAINARMLPTPCSVPDSPASHGQVSGQFREQMAAQGIGGQLNPTWVEWLMGYPPGWTDLSASETP